MHAGSQADVDSDAIRLEADVELLDSIRRDAPGAFDRFVDRFGDRIYGFGMRVCGEPEDARDVAQETLLKAFQSLRRLKEPGALRTWLYRVATNACLMKRRKGKFEPARELSLEELMPDQAGTGPVADVSQMPDDALERTELRRIVREAIEALPQHYRIVLILRDMEQLSTREVAQALDLAESAVKMRLHRARLMVRQRLVEELGRSTGSGR